MGCNFILKHNYNNDNDNDDDNDDKKMRIP